MHLTRHPKQEQPMISRRCFPLTMAMFAFGSHANDAAMAQSFAPTKPIRFIVPFPAGGSTDVGARVVAEYLSHRLGQQVYVENRAGANGTLGVEVAAKSAPDGYTFLV